jgi:hypothetical protein
LIASLLSGHSQTHAPLQFLDSNPPPISYHSLSLQIPDDGIFFVSKLPRLCQTRYSGRGAACLAAYCRAPAGLLPISGLLTPIRAHALVTSMTRFGPMLPTSLLCLPSVLALLARSRGGHDPRRRAVGAPAGHLRYGSPQQRLLHAQLPSASRGCDCAHFFEQSGLSTRVPAGPPHVAGAHARIWRMGGAWTATELAP